LVGKEGRLQGEEEDQPGQPGGPIRTSAKFERVMDQKLEKVGRLPKRWTRSERVIYALIREGRHPGGEIEEGFYQPEQLWIQGETNRGSIEKEDKVGHL
jgi:hypothetical protein